MLPVYWWVHPPSQLVCCNAGAVLWFCTTSLCFGILSLCCALLCCAMLCSAVLDGDACVYYAKIWYNEGSAGGPFSRDLRSLLGKHAKHRGPQ
ncbi:hypothetical protein M0802_005491 [Mischocyttarus mexicanus]|nr:hypothetical protein M0802_005491 [Mischocyttarus mexicanus]